MKIRQALVIRLFGIERFLYFADFLDAAFMSTTFKIGIQPELQQWFDVTFTEEVC